MGSPASAAGEVEMIPGAATTAFNGTKVGIALIDFAVRLDQARVAMELTVLDTLGKLYAYGHGLFGYCKVCPRAFIVSMPALIRERGGDSPSSA